MGLLLQAAANPNRSDTAATKSEWGGFEVQGVGLRGLGLRA